MRGEIKTDSNNKNFDEEKRLKGDSRFLYSYNVGRA